MKQTSFYCPQCQQPRLFTAEDLNHILYLLITVFMCGLFAPVWILISLTYVPVWRCSVCGFHDQQKYLSNPGLRQQEEAARQAAIHERERRRAQGIEDPSFADRAYDFVDHNKVGIILALVLVLVVVIGIVVTASNSGQTSAVATPTPTPNQMPDRQKLATSIQQEFAKKLPDIKCYTIGLYSDQLVIESAGVNEKWVADYRKSDNPDLAKLRSLSFGLVKIQRTGTQQAWTFQP